MALRPPSDFTPPAPPEASPSEEELRALWRRQEEGRRERQRAAAWRRALEAVRRESGGGLRFAAGADALPDAAFGPAARAALRPVPRSGRIHAAGVDTWSPCWYAEPGSALDRAISSLATEQARRARLLPDPVAGHRVGWFPEPRLVFVEGRAGKGRLLAASELPQALARLRAGLADLGIPLAGIPCAGLRRLDLAADLCPDAAVEGLALLECLAVTSLGPGLLCSYRAERRPRSVLIKSRAGRTLARVYDKGAQTGAAPPGRWLRFEAQWRFPRGERPSPERLDSDHLRERFARRFAPLHQAAAGFRLGGTAMLVERLGEVVRAGQLAPSRARSLAGYLLLAAAGLPQGARRTAYELERECRELGLSLSLLAASSRVDVATVLEECLAPEVWR